MVVDGKDPNLLRLIASGHETLTKLELLTLLLSYSAPPDRASAAAKILLDGFGNSIGAALACRAASLSKCDYLDHSMVGLLKVTEGLMLQALWEDLPKKLTLTSLPKLLKYLETKCMHAKEEVVILFFLDRKNHLIKEEVDRVGSLTGVTISIRRIIKRALELDAAALIIVHNHPSGDPSPSPEDIEATSEMERAFRIIGLVLHDHLIVGKRLHYSLKKKRYL